MMQSRIAESGQIAEQAAPGVSVLPWEIAADRICTAVESQVSATARRASETIYEAILSATQDYLRENVDFNLNSELSGLRSRNSALQSSARVTRSRFDALAGALDDLLAARKADDEAWGYPARKRETEPRLIKAWEDASAALAFAREVQP